MTTTAGHSFYIGPIVFFYNQVNDTGSWEPLVDSVSVFTSSFQWGLCYWFCICVHFQFSVVFVLLILYLCSLPVFSGVCVIDSVSVFTSSFQWGLCYWFCICVHFQFSVGFVLLILYLCSLPVFSGVCVIHFVQWHVFTCIVPCCDVSYVICIYLRILVPSTISISDDVRVV
jgi:hypothetical protein